MAISADRHPDPRAIDIHSPPSFATIETPVMFSGIGIVCFSSCYGLTLLLEISRLFFRVPVRMAITIGVTLTGLFAHSVYLTVVARGELMGSNRALFSNWHDWCLIVAWVLTATYLGLALSRPQNAVGIFLMPLVLVLIGVSAVYRESPSFAREEAMSVWRWVHGVSLLMGTVAVLLGFMAGLMFLVQSYRLKHKFAPKPGLKLPSLEWSLKLNRRALLFSTVLLGVGLASGIVLNLIQDETRLEWTDPIILSSGVLFLWLSVAAVFEFTYRPAREGRKVAYLTLASFVFLALAMFFVLRGQHAGTTNHDVSARLATARTAGRRAGARRSDAPPPVAAVRTPHRGALG